MIIVGDGPDIKDLIDLSKKEGLEDKIIFAGKAPWTDVPKYYSLCDVFVTASKTETQGLTVMEAMGASKPVVAIRDESFELMITDKKDGLFFDDEKSYVDMIYEVYKNKKLRDEISFNARLTADKYSPYNYAKNVLKVYEKVISKDTNVVKKVVHNVKNIFTKSGGKK